MSDERREADGGSTTLGGEATTDASPLPLDIGLLFVALVVSIPIVLGTLPVAEPVRILVGLPYVLFLPGYALTTALFPRRGSTASGEEFTALGNEAIPRRIRSIAERGLTGVERAGLGLAVSIVVAPLVGIGLDLLSLGFDSLAAVGAYAVFTGLASIVAIVRHRNLPPQDATGHTVSRALGAYRRSFGGSTGRTALVVLVTVCVLFAGATGVYALVAPQDASSFSDLSLLTENDEGEYVAGGYPQTLTTGEPETLYVGIENHEDVTTTYSVVVQIDRVRQDGNDLTVLSRDRVGTFSTELAAGEDTYLPTQVTAESVGEDLRLTYLLYRGEPPQNPTVESAYRHNYVWVDVTDGDS